MSLFGHVYSNEGSSAQQLITWVPHCREGCKRKSYTLWSRLDLLGVDQPSWQAFEEKRNRILGAPFALSSCPKIPFGISASQPYWRRPEVSLQHFKSGWCVYLVLLVKCFHCYLLLIFFTDLSLGPPLSSLM